MKIKQIANILKIKTNISKNGRLRKSKKKTNEDKKTIRDKAEEN